MWCQDEAGPYQTVPVAGQTWDPVGQARGQPHDYERTGTAQRLTRFHPARGPVRATGVTSAANATLHPWRQAALEETLAAVPGVTTPEDDRPRLAPWQTWEGRSCPHRSPLRLLLIWDTLTGHRSPERVVWLDQQGVLPWYTPLSGRWLHRAEARQRILVRRALAGQQPQTPDQLITWREETVTGWNAAPTPCTWHGKRYERRQRARVRRHQRLAGSGATCFYPSSIAR